MGLKFTQAKREKVWLKVLLEGASGSGKTYSALRVATGLAKKCDSRIAFIGTEGSRDKYYANEFDYDLLQLDEPYTPEKYIEALDAAIDGGYQVVICDSLSHEWLYLTDTHSKLPGNSFVNWGKLKPRHRKFMEKVLLSPIHVIATTRSKEAYVLDDNNGKSVPRKIGLESVQDKDINYEYTVSLKIDREQHIFTADKDNTHLFEGRCEVLTENDGVALYNWANSSDIPATVKEPPKYEEATITPEDELKAIKKDIVNLCVKAGGSKNDELMKTLKEFVPSGNPNAIKSIDKAKECLAKVKGVKPIE